MPQSFADELGWVPKSANLAGTLVRAYDTAREQGHAAVTLEHLLFALLQDPEALRVLDACNVDVAQLETGLSGLLGSTPAPAAGRRSEPLPGRDLLDILEAAAAAAQKSRRRQIDGAIVLAAIIGDGKSPAFGLLNAQGVTFDAAIRALKAGTGQGRGPRTAGSQPDAQPAPVPASAPPQPPPPPPPPEASAVLASVRARIQRDYEASQGQRADGAQSATLSEPQVARVHESALPPQRAESASPPPPRPPPKQPDAGPPPAPNYSPQPLSPPPQPPQPPRPPQPPSQRAEPEPWAPRAGSAAQSPPARPHPPQPPRRPPPTPQSSHAENAVPPLPPWPDPSGTAPAHNRSAHPGEPPRGYRPPATPQRPPEPSTTGPRRETGPLVEDIPRRMRVGVTETAEVRLARDRMERIAASLQPRSAAARPTGFITGAVSVRLRAPEGDFSIEAAAPETQWVENTLGLGYDDYATWRWNVTPRRRGKRRLQVLVSARTVRQDGLAAETALPDQVIQVRVRANYARALRRLLLFLLALGAGAGLGKYGEAGLELARQMLRTWGKL